MGGFCSYRGALDADDYKTIDIDCDDNEHPKCIDPFNKTKLQWNIFLKTCPFQRHILESDCVCIQRIVSVLSKYHITFLLSNSHDKSNNHVPSLYKLIKTDFESNYSIIYLLNDYIHILHHHRNLFQIQNHCKYSATLCGAIHHLLDESYAYSTMKTKDALSTNTLDIIHCNLYHSIYLQSIKSHKYETNASNGCNKQSLININIVKTEPTNYYEIAPRFNYKTKRILISDVPRKYPSLKQEILNNKIRNLTIFEWEFVAQKALKYSETIYIKNLKPTTFKQNVSVHKYSQRDILHQIMCLVLIFDFKSVSDSLRMSYQKQHNKESDEDVITRHSNYWHFARGIRRIVQVFGISNYRSTYCKDNYVWHSLIFDTTPKPHVIKWLRLKWNYPISTTANFKILQHGLKSNGVIVAFDRADGCSFDCGWISKYQFEGAALFVDNCMIHNTDNTMITKSIPIQCLIDSDKSMKYMELNMDVLCCIHGFIEIMNIERVSYDRSHGVSHEWVGRPIWNMDRDTAKWDSYLSAMDRYKEIQNMMINEMRRRFIDVMRNNKISMIIRKAIHSYFKEKKKLFLDLKMFKKEHSFLFDVLLSTDLKQIDIAFLGYLFPHLTQLIIHNIDILGAMNTKCLLSIFDALKQMNDDKTMDKYTLLIAGYIRIHKEIYNVCIPKDIVPLIKTFYPNIRCKLKSIIFTKCVDESVRKILRKLDYLKPNYWSVHIIHDVNIIGRGSPNYPQYNKSDLYLYRGKEKEAVFTKQKLLNTYSYSQLYYVA